MKLGMQVGLSRFHIALDGYLAHPPQRGTVPQFSAHICCGQMAGWIRMPLGRELGVDPSGSVRWGPSSPPLKRGHTERPLPNFRPMSIVAKRLDGPRQHLLGTKVGLGPGNTVLDGNPDPFPKKGLQPPPKKKIGMSGVAKQLAGSIRYHLVRRR